MSARIINLDLSDFLVVFFVVSLLIFIGKYVIFTKRTTRKYWIYPVTVLYFLALIEITIFPIEILGDEMLIEIFGTDKGMEWKSYIQYVPFATIKYYCSERNMYQIVGNILLLMPFPFLLELLYGKLSFAKLCICGAGMSLLIEMTQLFTDIATKHLSRVWDIDDIILNTAGAVLASAVIVFLRKTKIYSKLYHLCVLRKGVEV